MKSENGECRREKNTYNKTHIQTKLASVWIISNSEDKKTTSNKLKAHTQGSWWTIRRTKKMKRIATLNTKRTNTHTYSKKIWQQKHRKIAENRRREKKMEISREEYKTILPTRNRPTIKSCTVKQIYRKRFCQMSAHVGVLSVVKALDESWSKSKK